MLVTDASYQRYFREYLFAEAIRLARENTGEVIPISQARAMHDRVGQRVAAGEASFLQALDDELATGVRDYEPLFGDHTNQDPRCQAIWQDFVQRTGVAGSRRSGVAAQLPISPYDGRWANRSAVMDAGTELLSVSVDEIEAATAGQLADIHTAAYGDLAFFRQDRDGKLVPVGWAMSHEDACGLSALRPYISEGDYARVRDWALAGGQDPRTGVVDRSRFMSSSAAARSVAVLQELQAQGRSYTVERDMSPGQVRVRIDGTTLEVRLIDTQENERFAGARIYDQGIATYFTTNNRTQTGRPATYTPTPQECVELLRVAQGEQVTTDDFVVGTVGTYQGRSWNPQTRRSEAAPRQRSYHSERSSSMVLHDYVGPDVRPDSKVMIHRDATNNGLARFFSDVDDAETYLRSAVESARANLEAALDVEALVAQARRWQEQRAEGLQEDELVVPQLSSAPELAAIQRSYWDVLTGSRATLLRPGATQEMFEERLGQIGENLYNLDGFEVNVGNMNYLGTPEEKVRDHAQDVLDELVGTFDPREEEIDGEYVDQRFHPIRVATYMDSEAGPWRNLDSLAAAARRCEIQPEELIGTGFTVERVRDRLVRFDPNRATDLLAHDSPVLASYGQVLKDAVSRNGAELQEALVDESGVIKYTALIVNPKGGKAPVTGYLGQVFDRGEYGEIVTQFASGANATIVPGYEARIVAQRPGEQLSVEERTRLRGYEQLMAETISYQVSRDLLSNRSVVGEPTSLNRVYSQLQATAHPVDFVAQATNEHGELDEWTKALIETEARRVRYSNDIRENSTIFAEYSAAHRNTDPADDVHFDAWQLTGGRNMAVLDGTDAQRREAPSGFFDPVMTGSAKNQGVVRFLTAGARINPDGSITASAVEDDRTPLMLRPELASCAYDPFDRQQMTASALTQSAEVSSPTGVALMTFGGWTADDPIVISQRFAQEHQIRGVNGDLRDLVVGDKLSDLHGNKGVISLVVDPQMDLDQARELGLEQEVAWFRDNPQMDVVMSPFSLIGRRNAGSARELMAGPLMDLVDPEAEDGRTPDAIGQMRFIVTHLAVDAKTKIYDDEAIARGQGRKASAQLAWALGSQDCDAVLREFYGFNTGAEANLREMLTVMGIEMEADGTLGIVGVNELLDERPERTLFEQPELMRNAQGRISTMAMRREFGERIGDRGGDMEIPWPLTFPTGEQTLSATDSTWRLPVMSSHLRAGSEFEDGTVVAHDYTSRYLDIYEIAFKYRDAVERLALLPQDDTSKRAMDLRAVRDSAQRDAQLKFDSITNSIAERSFSGRHNIFKGQMMSARLADSATAVWTADPRLDLDQVAMGPAMADALGFSEDDHALIWRDPVLRDAGVRYLRVTIDERLTGIAINPVMDKCFDGDFDGDSVAVVRLHTQAAQRQAMQRLSVPANLLDLGVVDEDGRHPLAMQLSLDAKVAFHKDPALGDDLHDAMVEANQILADERAGADLEELWERRADLTGEITGIYRTALAREFGSALSFQDTASHLRSMDEVCVRTGAKGSPGKLAAYARNLGVVEGQDTGTPGLTKQDQEASMYATAVKTFGTGLAGAFSQRAVRALRNDELKAVLELTYPVTQSILQAKHDAAEARHKYEVLMGPGRDLWRGRLLEREGGAWKTVRNDGVAVQATPEQWKAQFNEFYSAPDGFNVPGANPQYVERVADALTNPDTGLMRNLEEDPKLSGAVMDRLAYGGTFRDLLAVAQTRENLYDGKMNELFASKPTQRQREAARTWEYSGGAIESKEPVLEAAQVKRDVLAADAPAARARTSSRRSDLAVAVGGTRDLLESSPSAQLASLAGFDAGAPHDEANVVVRDDLVAQRAARTPTPAADQTALLVDEPYEMEL